MPSTTGLSATLLALAAQAAALKIPFTQVVRPHAHSFSASSGAVNALTAPSATVADVFDNLYLATITLGTQKFNVQLDTGSSDLWVQAGVAASSFNATDLALPAVNITYGKGSVSGTPATAKFTLGSYVVDEQAFLDVTEADMGSLFAQGANGVLGLSFNSASVVQTAVSAAGSLPASKGQSVLSSLFAQQPAGARDFIAFSLGRVGDLDTTSQGSFSIGEVDNKFAAVNNAPKLSVFANKNAGALQRWTVPVDAIQVAGATYNVTTAVKNASGKQLALLDTGSSLVLLPQHAITAIYSSIDGAKYDKETDMWFVPCLNQTTVSFVFGGQSFVVHPLDVTHPTQAGLKDGTVVTYCVNTFQAIKDASEFDVVLGDAFLRNVFSVYDFGDVDTAGKTANPFVKLLSVTDKSSAPADFVQSRKQALETLPPLAPMTEAATFAAVKNFVLQSSAKSSSTEKAASSSAAAPKSTHKTTHKIGFSGKKGKSKTKTTTTTIKKPVIALADASDASSTGLSSQVQKLLDFSPILLGLLAANVILGVGLCILGGYLLRSNRAKKLKREPLRRAGTDGTVTAAYEPVTTGEPMTPLPYRDSEAVEEGAAFKGKQSKTYRDSGVAFGETEAARRLSRAPGPLVDTVDLGVRDNSPFLDPNARSSFAGRDSIALSDNGPVPVPRPFPTSGSAADRLSVVSSAPEGTNSRRSRAPSAASASRDSVYSQGQGSQGQGSPFRSPSHDSLHTTGADGNELVPPQPAFAGGRQPSHVQRDSFHMPSPSADSPNAQLPLVPQQQQQLANAPGVGLRPVAPNRQPSMSLYDAPQTSEFQLASQQRRYSHVPPAAMGGPPRQPSFNLQQGSPSVPPRSPARSIPGPPPGAAPPMPMARPPSA